MATSHNVDSRCRNLNIEPSPMSLVIVGIQSSISACNWNHTNHSLLLRTFGLNATSPYDSYLPLIFGKFALIWGHFQNILTSRFWGRWGRRGQTTSKSKTTKIINENLLKLDEVQNLASATSKMTSWLQRARKRLSGFFKISGSSWEKWAIARLSSQTFTNTSF